MNNTLQPDKLNAIPVDSSVQWNEAPGELVHVFKDARHVALEALRDELCSFTFFRSVDNPFKLSVDNFHVDGIDSEDTFAMPAVAVLPTVETVIATIQPSFIESSFNVFKRGYALVRLSEHTEEITLEVWTATKSERRAILSATDQLFSPVQQMTGLRLILKNYWHQPCRFTLERIERANEDGFKNRWRTLIHLTLDIPIVRLVPVVNMVPMVGVVDE